jgi:hypothetical protein
MISDHTSAFRGAAFLVILLAPFAAGNAQKARWTVTREPGAVQTAGGVELTGIERGTVSPKGTFVGIDRKTQTLIVVDPNGTSASRLGRQGRGPGEYEFVQMLSYLGDTLALFDPLVQRLTFFFNGKLLRSEQLDEISRRPPNHMVFPFALLSDGTLLGNDMGEGTHGMAVAAPPAGGASGAGEARVTRRIGGGGGAGEPVTIGDGPGGGGGGGGMAVVAFRSGSSGPNLEMLHGPRPIKHVRIARPSQRPAGKTLLIGDGFALTERMDAFFVSAPNNKPGFHGAQPWIDGDLLSVSPSGHMYVKVERKSVESGGNAAYTVTARTPKGQAYKTSVPYKPIELSDAVIDKWMKMYITDEAAKNFASVSAARQAALQALVRPKYVPPVVQARVAADGSVWLERNVMRGPNDPRQWDVLDPQGKYIATATTPAMFKPIVFMKDRIWGSEPDDDGNPQIVRYRINH